MMRIKCCGNCWFYCHGNRKCYAVGLIKQVNDCFQEEAEAEVRMPDEFCHRWAFDGLEEWERSETVSGCQLPVVSECVTTEVMI